MTKTRDLSDFLIEGGVLDKPLGTPHIVPGLLYPSYVASGTSNKLLDGTTAHSGAFGTEQSDGRKYYYTNIAGSKPIKDPRIGAHFGNQRHMIGSRQLLEQETAQSGEDIYSFDGREFFRGQCPTATTNENNSGGVSVNFTESSNYFEITGYFNAVNLVHKSANGTRTWLVHVDGVQAHSALSVAGAVDTPLDSRFVRATSLSNIDITSSSSLSSDTTLGIHTLKMKNAAANSQYIYGIELIAQDTTSTTTKSQIQIPAQEVVSFGKKFSISAETKHYNPFAFKTDGTTAWTSGNHNGTAWPIGTGSSTKIHTATSLGLAAWLHSSNYYYPYNGGRVVKWIDADGVIQTSVNMMPPNARSIGNSASLTNAAAKANASIANNTYFPTMEAGTVDHSQAEVAKTFHWREFGNGAANGGTGHNKYADASMLNTTNDDIAYVMDDGLTSLSADDCLWYHTTGTNLGMGVHSTNDSWYITFIGTGFTVKTPNGTTFHLVQNLPYGTHIVKLLYTGSPNGGTYTVDGVAVVNSNGSNDYWTQEYLTFHQPKMPPIPEDAVVIADYMLMADFVKQTGTGADIRTQISKGVRYCNGSRDHFYGGASAASDLEVKSDSSPWGLTGGGSPASSDPGIFKLPFFGTTGLSLMEQSNQAHSIKLNDATTVETALDNTGDSQTQGDVMSIAESVTLGQTSIETTLLTGSYHFFGHLVTSPIHTSHHYQPFETPYLKELIGGDRNMEQTNLVCSPNGKTWDEVTRDTSYIGPGGFNLSSEISHAADGLATIIFTLHRGGIDGVSKIDSKYASFYSKDFAIAYERMIFLRDGTYVFSFGSHSSKVIRLVINGNKVQSLHENIPHGGGTAIVKIKRGDSVYRIGGYIDDTDDEYSVWACHRIGDN